ncbi:hypothetical protein PENTCL1PPCAC_11036, partial [Pristionchus entomophagus]
ESVGQMVNTNQTGSDVFDAIIFQKRHCRNPRCDYSRVSGYRDAQTFRSVQNISGMQIIWIVSLTDPVHGGTNHPRRLFAHASRSSIQHCCICLPDGLSWTIHR